MSAAEGFSQHAVLTCVKVYSSSKKVQLDVGDILWYWGRMNCSVIGSASVWTNIIYLVQEL